MTPLAFRSEPLTQVFLSRCRAPLSLTFGDLDLERGAVRLDRNKTDDPPFGLPTTLRAHLTEIGLKLERMELFKSTTERIRIRGHDLRDTFVTVSLANGRTEAWISDRTGHRSSQMIGKYKRTARTFAELSLSVTLSA